MHRLQLSLREEQVQYLAARAEREGVSMAEVVRRLLDDEASQDTLEGSDSILAIAGLIKDELPLINGIPVSEDPDLYLYSFEAEAHAAMLAGTSPAIVQGAEAPERDSAP